MRDSSRYLGQEHFTPFGVRGQRELRMARIVIVGVGALGSVAAELLCRAGVGKIVVIDRDIVEKHNLQRQALFTEEDIHKSKTIAAVAHLKKINSTTILEGHYADLTAENCEKLLGKPTLIIDGVDSVETRMLINDYCSKNKIPWVHGAAIKDTCEVMSILPGKACYGCVHEDKGSGDTCETAGILNAASHLAASVQVSEALKIIAREKREPVLFRASLFDDQLHFLHVVKRKTCSACNGKFDYLEGRKGTRIVSLCGKGRYLLRGKHHDLTSLFERLRVLGGCERIEGGLRFKDMLIFSDRAIVPGKDENWALSLYRTYIGL